MKNLIIFGIGEIAQVIYEYFKKSDNKYKIKGFTVDREYCNIQYLFGLPVVPFDKVKNNFSPDNYDMFIAVSYKKMNKIREEKYISAKKMGYKFPSFISTNAYVWDNVKIGENTFIFENNVIQPFVEIGNNVIIWSGNHIGHHTKIDDHCFIASHAVISGSVNIKSYCFIGVNATIRDNITIEKENIIGAGSIILKSTNEGDVFGAVQTKKFPLKSNQLKNI